jgi:hypothetical protein
MTARRNRKYKRAKNQKKRIFILFVGTLVILLIFFLIRFFNTGVEWGGKEKINLVVNGKQDIVVTTLDPEKKEIIILKIPLNTEVEVARNLGRWKLESVWQLGKNEGIGGKLLAETVTRFFKLPVYLYIDSTDMSFLEGNLLASLKILFYPTDSNLSKKDLFRIVRFTTSVKNPDRNVIDLKSRTILKKAKLKSGEEGYEMLRDFDQSIAALFSNEYVSENLIIVKIVNKTGDRLISSELGEVVESTGAKVAQVVNSEVGEGDCSVSSEYQRVGEYFSKLLSCEYEEVSNENFDVVITINEDFVERF